METRWVSLDTSGKMLEAWILLLEGWRLVAHFAQMVGDFSELVAHCGGNVAHFDTFVESLALGCTLGANGWRL
ncbi:hypothetical protein [Sporosarcina beigongshangi]|uniref:hypothetical protein n=1 Tax=Sporosarcina beigongshangi TaxID=2782538 RepID=UPI002ACDCC8E|nr:hypothetical protein [Sporosarcina beigongshangi]